MAESSRYEYIEMRTFGNTSRRQDEGEETRPSAPSSLRRHHSKAAAAQARLHGETSGGRSRYSIQTAFFTAVKALRGRLVQAWTTCLLVAFS